MPLVVFMPSQQTLLETYRYESSTGKLFLQKLTSRFDTRFVGKEVGQPRGAPNNQYLALTHLGSKYLVHRIIWAMHFGEIPKGKIIDHKDHNAFNNLIDNLRLTTRAGNNRNQSLYRVNKSGCAGIDQRRGKWRVRIGAGGLIYVGEFHTLDEATTARKAAEIEHGYHPNHGK